MKKTDAQEHAANCCPVLVVALEKDLTGFKKFVEIRLRQFHLSGYYTCDDIINECAVRMCVAMSQGQSISCPPGWLRVTAFNYIQELYRQEKKATSYDPATLSNLALFVEEDSNQEPQYRLLHESLQTLPREQRELLKLRFLRQMSWDSIVDHFKEKGTIVPATTLRKRGERALMALRRIYLARVKDLE